MMENWFVGVNIQKYNFRGDLVLLKYCTGVNFGTVIEI